MQFRKFLVLCSLVFVFPLAGQSQLTDQKVKAIANDFCTCFKPLQDSMSKEAIDLLIKAGASENPDSLMKAFFEEITDNDKK